jgi:MOSC domain-containing protein YiiM
MDVEIVQLLASPVHRYAGRPSDGPAPVQTGELVESIEIREGLGVVGDRYFGRRAHRDAAVTIMSAEALPPGADLRHTRRNILLGGVAVDELVGATITLDSGAGAVVLRVARPARPCAWLDVVIAPGTRAALRNLGGVRCAALSSGVVRVGPAQLTVAVAADAG